ncbi:gamma-glutamylcyclotransferase [Mameliella alba]|uniref:gamma-glutamylcyclotransferase n=1 Tax=Mameliella alba TaxID=561184 RepID=UPI001430841C|nr:gamma-glutamylcyclotransferase [Mameliella alba]
MTTNDPFRHHPGLRALIKPREDSFFADFHVDKAIEIGKQHGRATDWILTEAEIEADRAEALAGRMDRDLWVFAYGSLMWDPAVRFTEVRRGFAPGAERRFILFDINGARGTEDQPGLMAALDAGQGCHGLIFRIAARDVPDETRSLWHRERLGEAYLPRFISVETDHGTEEALAFLANHAAGNIRGDLRHDEQVRLIATGEGFLGTSREYLENLAAHFEEMKIEDAEVTRLVTDVRAYASG